jgi:hypothetical protein
VDELDAQIGLGQEAGATLGPFYDPNRRLPEQIARPEIVQFFRITQAIEIEMVEFKVV